MPALPGTWTLRENTVNLDIFACIIFREFTKIGNFALKKKNVLPLQSAYQVSSFEDQSKTF